MRFGKAARYLVAAMMLTIMFFHAAPADAARLSVNASGVLVIDYNEAVPGNRYSVFLLADDADPMSFTAQDILFMDQDTADSQGKISLAFIRPDYPACQAVIGGDFGNQAQSPLVCGFYRPAGLYLPGMLEEIEASAFEGGTFSRVYVGSKVKTIGSRAFANCMNLCYVEILGEDTQIAPDAFEGCGALIIGCKEGSTAYDYAVEHLIACRFIGQ